MSKSALAVRFLAVILGCTLIDPLSGQESRATIGGRVMDVQGAAVPNASVRVVSDETGVERQTRTNSQGNWIVQFLLPGRYHFSVSAPAFKTTTSLGVTLQAADNKELDVQLELGAVSQSVEIHAEAPLIDTTSATSGTVISSANMTEMPTISHVPTLLAVLSPGVVAQDQNNNIVRPWSYIGRLAVYGGRRTQQHLLE
jgi:hypothetical protein